MYQTRNQRYRSGFALPTILISSIVMLIVLLVSVSSTATVRVALKEHYYSQLAQAAGEAGVAYAQACLDANNGVPQWSDTNPLTPSTDCSGNQFPGSSTVKVLVVGGGGGGGTNMGGGGGGGGVVYNSSFPISNGSFPVVVGQGGAGAPAGTGGAHPSIPGKNGGNSTFSTITAIGGGRGGMSYNGLGLGIEYGASGGSGGGASGYNSTGAAVGAITGGAGTAGQGYAGGNQGAAYYSGGGGGAGGPGASGNNKANGGVGVSNSILGTAYYWGGGGGGSGYSIVGGNGGNGGGGGGAIGATTGGSGINAGSPGGGGSTASQANTPGGNGGANTGGGGGAGAHYWTNNKGGDGGSGIVIISYPTGSLTATGGTITTNGGNTIHTFTNSGTFTVTNDTNSICPSDNRCSVTYNDEEKVRSSFSVGLPTIGSGAVKVLVVGGGGGGARAGSGGGAGGYVYKPDYALSTGDTNVTVGDGGAGGTGSCPGCAGSKGEDSVFGNITAEGGGAGAKHGGSGGGNADGSGGNGGSGGGGAIMTSGAVPAGGVGSQGNDGGAGYSPGSWTGGSGGGGGAGGPGSPGGNSAGSGNGGDGVLNSISGFPVYYAGGGGGGEISGSYVGGSYVGGGGWSRIDAAGTSGQANTGGGGGGGSYNGSYFDGGNGGSGVVIVSYPTGSVDATGGTVTYSGGNTIHTFNSDGIFHVNSIDTKKTIPNSGYVQLLRSSNNSVWRTYTQPSSPPAVVADQCAGQAKSIYGWNNASVVTTSTFSQQPLAKYISVSSNPINPGPFYLRKDFSITRPGTYKVLSAADDVGVVWLDGVQVGTLANGTQTNNVTLTAGCHTLYIKVINNGVAPNYGAAVLALTKSNESVPTIVTDSSWRVAAGATVHYSSPNYYADPGTWTPVREYNNPAWSEDTTARNITTVHNNSSNNYPTTHAFFRDNRTVTVDVPTEVRVAFGCDDQCAVYLDGSVIANDNSTSYISTTLTLSPGSHEFGVNLYNTGGLAAIILAVTRTSDNLILTHSDSNWSAADFWGPDQEYYSYADDFIPNPRIMPDITAKVLVVGGGGGGGSDMGGGGGGGGVVYDSAYNVSSRSPITVTVGDGGAGAAAGISQARGQNGGNSIFGSIVAFGGGGGGSEYANNNSIPNNGGSGGGSAGCNQNTIALGIIGQGNKGGATIGCYYPTGGGGAGGAGSVNPGHGGIGISNSILGTAYYWGGGGGGSGYTGIGGNGGNGGGGGGAVGTTTGGAGLNPGSPGGGGTTVAQTNKPGGDGGDNTGGGGGGGSHYNSNNYGGNGGSGIVIISYTTGSMTATGGTVTTSGGNTIHTFTSSGTFTVTSVP